MEDSKQEVKGSGMGVAASRNAQKRHVLAGGLDLPTTQSRPLTTSGHFCLMLFRTDARAPFSCSHSSLLTWPAYEERAFWPEDTHFWFPCQLYFSWPSRKLAICFHPHAEDQALGPGPYIKATHTQWGPLAESQPVLPSFYCPSSHLNLKHGKYLWRKYVKFLSLGQEANFTVQQCKRRNFGIVTVRKLTEHYRMRRDTGRGFCLFLTLFHLEFDGGCRHHLSKQMQTWNSTQAFEGRSGWTRGKTC